MSTSPPTTRPRLRRFALIALALCALLFALYTYRAPILIRIASAWSINEPLENADAILVMGGGLQYRTFEAARLYQSGYAPRILIAQARPSPTDELGLTTREKDLMKQVLYKKGVPESAITEVGENVTSSFEEAKAVRAWMAANNAKRVIIPTDIFHTRRARWLFRKQLNPAGFRAVIRSITPREYSPTDWWQHEEGVITFQNEVVKYVMYLWKYR